MSEHPPESRVRAVEAKHQTAAAPGSPTCALCALPIASKETHQVIVIAERTEPLFVRPERWCEGCASLVRSVGLFRHIHLPKRAR